MLITVFRFVVTCYFAFCNGASWYDTVKMVWSHAQKITETLQRHSKGRTVLKGLKGLLDIQKLSVK